tara:strand:+ start:444 stop:878 length:435 start_codon:yes stop_codon:yes gene_type:complete
VKQKRRTSTNSASEKKPYKSIYKEGYVTPANYITELVFEKRNEAFNSGKCPERFWTDPKYTGPYKGQVIQAGRLLKKYKANWIIKAIKAPESKYIHKLQDKKLIPIIEKFEKQDKETAFEENSDIIESKPIKAFGFGKNKLRGL